MATHILAKLLADDRLEYIPTMTTLFNKKRTFYKGTALIALI